MAGARRLVRGLRQLGEVRAPASVQANIKEQLDLTPDEYFSIQTPLGPVWVAFNDHGVSAVTQKASAGEFQAFVASVAGRPAVPAPEPPPQLVRALARRLSGDTSSQLRFDLRGLGQFERAVLLKAMEIPHGEVRPYAWIAREIGHPRAVRAVGTALARNPIPVFIPCHRVVRSDGRIGNYGLGGRQAKLAILAAEGVDAEMLERLAQRGVRYLGSDTTRIFCFPTCRHARRVSERHMVRFGSTLQAHLAGYRPCKVCRPADVAA
ncbi:MAG: methylated-DNA--[protein]-cysteine S-methyltransferase [Chloroflexota bacterium]|nr:methylated-DNA--[protein]-cysteine S-methyltransferase [Chloroflexota bacterium]